MSRPEPNGRIRMQEDERLTLRDLFCMPKWGRIEIPASVTSIDSTAFNGCSEDLVIVAEADSEAEAFAAEHGILCVTR